MKIIKFSQKITAGFSVILLLMAILGFVSYIAFIKMECLSHKLTQALLLDMFLDESMGSHQKWMNDLAHTLLLGRSFAGSLDPYHCDFGKWFYNFKPPDEQIRVIHEKIEEPHRILHESAHKIIQLYDFMSEDLDLLLKEKKHNHLKWLRKLHQAIEQKDRHAFLPILCNDKSCDFGLWYHQYILLPNNNKELEKYYQLLAEPHQRIHETAELLLSLGLQNQWGKAHDLFNQKTFPLSEEFLKYFSELESLVQERLKNNRKARDIYISRTVPAMEELQGMVDEISTILMSRIGNLEKEYRSVAEKSQNFILFSIIVILLLSIVLIFLIPPVLTKPITELTRFTNRIADGGDLSEIITIKNEDEIGQLASSFNKMIHALRKSREEQEEWSKTLEKKVETRTKDLQGAYQQLETAQSHLIQSSKLASLGELAAGMAHEINNPMNVIMSYAELLPDEVLANPEANEYCRGILQAGKRISDIIKKLLTFARQDNLQYTPSYIPDLIDGVLSFMKKRLEKDGIRVEKYYEPNLPPIFVRQSQIEQVFLNLIINAKDAMLETNKFNRQKDEKLLTIKIKNISKPSPPIIQISLRDTGTGIKPDDLDKIFDPFFTTKREDKGTGLGLSISYGIIKAHGGNINVESKRGEFTTFTIELPIEQNLTDGGSDHEKHTFN